MFGFCGKWYIVKKKQKKKKNVKNKKRNKKDIKIIIHFIGNAQSGSTEQKEHRYFWVDKIKTYKCIDGYENTQFPGIMKMRQY